MKKSAAGIVLTVVLVLLVLVGIGVPSPPDALPANAPPEVFSAARARVHLDAIAREPHAMGTAEHALVRDYILSEIRSLGIEPELQEAIIARDRFPGALFARTINILARLEGRGEGKAVLVMSHYDTVPTSPGAGDASSGVATMLETIRALREGGELENDVIFLFTDGEEAELLGAFAFVEQHPWARDVGVLLNFEARGTTGPSLMFETSPGNGPLLSVYDQAMAHPAATSYSYEVYRRMPNDTDYTAFKGSGVAGLNFAFIGGGTAYHCAQDSLERIDLRSVQQHGEAALSLARQFGNADLDGPWRGRDAVYFNLPGNLFIRYSSAWVLPLTVVLVIAAFVLIFAGFRRGRLTGGGLAVSLLAVVLGAVVSGGLMVVVAGALMRFYNFVLWNGWTSVSLNFLGFALLASAVTLAVFALARRKLGAENLFGAGLLIWTVATVAVSLVAPGGSYLFALPLATALAAGALWLRGDEADDRIPPLFLLALVVSAAVTVFLWAPTFHLVGLALGRGAAAVVGALVPLLLLGPLLPNLSSSMPEARGRRRWLSTAVLVVLAVAVLLAVRSASHFSADNRRIDSLLYHLDTEAGRAEWFSFDFAADEWTSEYLSDTPEKRPRPAVLGGDGEIFASDAPVLDFEGASIRWLGEEPTENGRRIRVQLSWPFEVHRAVLLLRSESPLGALSSEGRSVEPEKNTGPGDASHKRRIYYYAPPPEGISLTVELDGDGPLEIEAIAQRYGLPDIVGPRPAHLMPRFGWTTDSTYVRSVHTWTPGVETESPEEPEDGSESPDAAEPNG